jgi:hypothetical protein
MSPTIFTMQWPRGARDKDNTYWRVVYLTVERLHRAGMPVQLSDGTAMWNHNDLLPWQHMVEGLETSESESELQTFNLDICLWSKWRACSYSTFTHYVNHDSFKIYEK